MPEMTFTVRWPDGRVEDCYSPSLVMQDHLEVGAEYSGRRVRRPGPTTALEEAGERVRARYGFLCTSALAAGRGDPGPRRRARRRRSRRASSPWHRRSRSEVRHDVSCRAVPSRTASRSRSSAAARPASAPPGTCTQRGIDHVVLERATVAHDWRDRRWDAFTLVTPNFQCRLPGLRLRRRRAGRLHDPRADAGLARPVPRRASTRRCTRAWRCSASAAAERRGSRSAPPRATSPPPRS